MPQKGLTFTSRTRTELHPREKHKTMLFGLYELKTRVCV